MNLQLFDSFLEKSACSKEQIAKIKNDIQSFVEGEKQDVPVVKEKLNKSTIWDSLVKNLSKQSSVYIEDVKNLSKQSSVYIEDVKYSDLSPEVKKEVDRFITCQSGTKLSHYGMVIRELLNNVDKANYDAAKEHVAKQDIDKDEFYKKLKTKYIIMMRGRVADGHHTIAKAEKLGVTSSLNILDLTPAMYQ